MQYCGLRRGVRLPRANHAFRAIRYFEKGSNEDVLPLALLV
jgi:hypothetical protein